MSGVTTATVLAGAAVATTAYTIYAGERADRQADQMRAQQAQYQAESLAAQKKANDEALAMARGQASSSEQARNAANARRPNTDQIMAAAESAAKGGVASTMLTGPAGVNPDDLKLGKSTLLGA